MDQKKAILVIGAGDATGGAIARRFAREGYIACVARRDFEKLKPLVAQIEAAGGIAHPFACDARTEDQVVKLVDQVEREVAPIEVAVFNVGANLRSAIAELSTEMFKRAWELGCLGGFLMGREVTKPMLARGRGTIIFTGATASLRGRETFAAFASAKHALRALAQSMARELWPKGIHVAHVIIDGPITPRAGDCSPLRHLPKPKKAVLGLVSTKVPEIETADALKRRIDEATKFIELERLCLSPQCGFASVPARAGRGFPMDLTDRKLARVVEVAG